MTAEQPWTQPATREPDALGRIDLYGFSRRAGGILFIGWVSHRLVDELGPGAFLLRTDATEVSAAGIAGCYVREELGDLGLGVVIFMSLDQPPAGRPLTLTTVAGNGRFAIVPGNAMQEFAESDPPPWLNSVLTEIQPAFPEALARALVCRERHARPSVLEPLIPDDKNESGFIEVFGYSETLGGWLISGWVPPVPPEHRPAQCKIGFDGTIEPEIVARLAFFERADLGALGVGIVLFIEAPRGHVAEPHPMEIAIAGRMLPLQPIPGVTPISGQNLVGDIRGRLERADEGPAKMALLNLLVSRPYRGEATLNALIDRVLLHIEVAIFCPPDGLILKGWVLSALGAVREIRLCSEQSVAKLDFDNRVRVPRPDVIDTVGREYGFDEQMCGFIIFIPGGYSSRGPSYLEIETTRGEIAFANLPAPKLHGLAAIRQILGDCEFQYADVVPAFEHVLGPSVERLNLQRLGVRPEIATVQFGTPPADPVYCVVVPLYRRLEYMELQFALFARDPATAECEIIYVLDDPPKRRELENLAASIYERFRIPFTVALVSQNLGFAPANNIGLEMARGRYVCFLNSDVFAHTTDWLAKLRASLDARPDLGAIGPLLLFEDGSVQHQGMTWRRRPQFGNWYYNDHLRMGLRPPPQGGVEDCLAITGACIMMRTGLAKAVGGFDERYVVGDFEDSDLCLKLGQQGLGCAVDLDVRLCHLVRKSQPSAQERWRLNLILYNAWQHDRRWSGTIGAALERTNQQGAGQHAAGQQAVAEIVPWRSI